jgi:hypothetical protein
MESGFKTSYLLSPTRVDGEKRKRWPPETPSENIEVVEIVTVYTALGGTTNTSAKC